MELLFLIKFQMPKYHFTIHFLIYDYDWFGFLIYDWFIFLIYDWFNF